MDWKLGHIRASLSSRQIFLVRSVASSLERESRGRPRKTIREAAVEDEEREAKRWRDEEDAAERGDGGMAWG